MERARVGGTVNAPVGQPSGEQGFTLVETMVAMLILAMGLMTLAQIFAVGVAQLAASGPDIIAREKASDAIESVFTARDTRTITWAQIRNVAGASGNDNGVFLDGERPLRTAGNDGLLNTADDGAVESVTLPGPDNQLGTADDQIVPLSNFTREIEVRDVGPNLRRVRVIIRYLAGSGHREYQLETYISSFA
jgi:prepilin-type N-terminal cleavage/methylation domain-containing protein